MGFSIQTIHLGVPPFMESLKSPFKIHQIPFKASEMSPFLDVCVCIHDKITEKTLGILTRNSHSSSFMKHSFTVTYAFFSPRRFGRTRARLAPRRCASPPRCWSPTAPSQRRSWRLDSWRSEDRSDGTCWNWLEHLLDTDLLHSVTWLVVWNMNFILSH